MSEWSPWLRINSTKDGSYQEERFRCVCKAVVVDPLQLRTPSLKTSMRFCTPGGEDCDTGGNYLSILIILLIYCTRIKSVSLNVRFETRLCKQLVQIFYQLEPTTVGL